MGTEPLLPAGATFVRVTDDFDERSVPRGLLAAHQLAAGTWARLVVRDGTLCFAFEDRADQARHLGTGDEVVIPPQCPHRVLLTGSARFAIEFYRVPRAEEVH